VVLVGRLTGRVQMKIGCRSLMHLVVRPQRSVAQQQRDCEEERYLGAPPGLVQPHFAHVSHGAKSITQAPSVMLKLGTDEGPGVAGVER
jgi:hypothetical protein